MMLTRVRAVTYPIVLSSPGQYILVQDLVAPSGVVLQINGDDISIDLNGFRVAGGTDHLLRNNTVTGGAIEGIAVYSTRNYLEGNLTNSNTSYGLKFFDMSSSNVYRNHTARGNGGMPGACLNSSTADFCDDSTAGSQVFYFSPDVRTEIDPATMLERNIVRYDTDAFSIVDTLPQDTATSAVHRMDEGDWLFTVGAATALNDQNFLPTDVVRYDNDGAYSLFFDGGDNGKLTISLDAPVTVNNFDYLPGEVARITVRPAATPGNCIVSWTVSCSTGAEDYGVYEGDLSALRATGDYNHTALVCSDAGNNLQEEITPVQFNSYFIVVPLNTTDEGSYGSASSGSMRPRGTATCRTTQEVQPCP